MATTHKRPEALYFETFPGRADIQISKTLTTPEGDEIRGIVTTSGKVVLTGVGKRSDDILILEGFDPNHSAVVYASVWDVLGPIIKDIADKIGTKVNGGGTCTSTTMVVHDNKAGTTTVTMSQTCRA